MTAYVAKGWLPKCVKKTKTSNLGTKLRILSGYENSCEWLQRKSTMGMKENKTGNILQIDFLKKFYYNIYIKYEKVITSSCDFSGVLNNVEY